MIEKLLAEISAINKKHTLINQKTGTYFNIFDIADISSDEVTICKVLCELLDSNGSHCQGDAFLRLFVNDVLKLDFTELDFLTARIHREHYVGGRRIDIAIISLNFMIPIEVKIFASDQDGQCFDYAKTKQNSDLYYLTLDGRLPGLNSANGLSPIMEDEEIIGYEGVKQLSFSGDIADWLNKCLALPEIIRIAPIREILLQFKDTLYKLTGQTEDSAKMEIVNTLISSAENMRNAIDIANALPEAKTDIMLNLLRELRRLFAATKKKIYDYDEDVIKEYYFSRKQLYPCLSVEILKLPHNLTATLCIEIEWNLYYCFAFTKVDKNGESCEYVETERVKADYPDIYVNFTNAVFEVMGLGDKTANTVYWDYISDDKGGQFDFKNFSPPCTDLATNYLQQAENIFTLLNGYVERTAMKMQAEK
jgi:hypothetical protein